MKIVTAAEMREIDRITTEQYGIPSLKLMENAGIGVAEYVLAEYPDADRICVVCGKGNNGGDGFVVARKLIQAKKNVDVLLLARPEEVHGDAATMMAGLPLRVKSVSNESGLSRIDDCDLIIDAILGTGIHPPVQGLYASAIEAINESGKPVVSVDIPSGADADSETSPPLDAPVVRAEAIITFTALKPAHIFQFPDREVGVRDIGTPHEAIVSANKLNLITRNDFSDLFTRRPADSHKGDYGHVLIFAGSTGKAGAAAMCGMAAMRGGAGLVTVSTPGSVLPTVAGFAPELMTQGLDETPSGAISILAMESVRSRGLVNDKSVVAIGPGLSRDPDTAHFVRTLVERTVHIPIVLDADGINAFEDHAHLLNGNARPLVITPHPGEMARLLGISAKQVNANRLKVARDFAVQHHCVVVLKGHRTLVALPDGETWINTTGNPGMATGGTGDVLTGLIAALIAQHPQQIPQAVIAAVHLHGIAGDLARDQMGEISMSATDILLMLPMAIREMAE